MLGRLLSSGTPSPNPAAQLSFLWRGRAKPHSLDPPLPLPSAWAGCVPEAPGLS